MSLKDFGISEPLVKGDQRIGWRCLKCKQSLGIGSRVAQIPSRYGQAGLIACATCETKGRKIHVPNKVGYRDIAGPGQTTILRIKDGDASPYPVVTTDGRQFKADEIEPVEDEIGRGCEIPA